MLVIEICFKGVVTGACLEATLL